MTYEAIRCPCGDKFCKKWQVRGVAAEAKFERREALAVAKLLSKMDSHPWATYYIIVPMEGASS
jgi:hypothetical protein